MFFYVQRNLLSLDNLKYLVNSSLDTCSVLTTRLCKVCLTATATLHLARSLTNNLAGVQALFYEVGTH